MDKELKFLVVGISFSIIAFILAGVSIAIAMNIPPEIKVVYKDTNGYNGVYMQTASPQKVGEIMNNVYKTGEWVCIDIEKKDYLDAVGTCNHEVAHRISSNESWAEFMETGNQEYYYDLDDHALYTKYEGEFVKLEDGKIIGEKVNRECYLIEDGTLHTISIYDYGYNCSHFGLQDELLLQIKYWDIDSNDLA